MYQFVDDTLYRRRPNGVKLKCVCREDGKELLAEIHRGMCVGEHSNFKNFLRTCKIMVMLSNERGECVHVPSWTESGSVSTTQLM